jgi:hypothetical protein
MLPNLGLERIVLENMKDVIGELPPGPQREKSLEDLEREWAAYELERARGD